LAQQKQSQFKANRRALPGNHKLEILNPKQGQLTGHYLKKQSQFAKCQMNASYFPAKEYEIETALWLRKNKANSKPISRSRNGFGL